MADVAEGDMCGLGPGSAAIVSASIGAGHDGAAAELARRLRARGVPVSVLDFLDVLPAGLGGLLRNAYATQLRRAPASWGWLYSALARHGRLALLGAALGGTGARGLLAALPPRVSVVVSTYPLASQALGRLVVRGHLTAPTVTYLTDLAVHPLWVNPDIGLHIAPHRAPAHQARRMGARRTAVASPLVRPQFRTGRLAVARARSDRPLAVVVSGSWGVGEVEAAARDLAATDLVNTLVICGHNDALRRRLDATGMAALGWVDDVQDVLAEGDVVVQNAGGLTAYETLALGVPMISYRCLPGHGLDTSRVMAGAGLAPLVRHRGDLEPALRAVLSGATQARTAEAVRALFDAPDAAWVITAFVHRSRAARVSAVGRR